ARMTHRYTCHLQSARACEGSLEVARLQAHPRLADKWVLLWWCLLAHDALRRALSRSERRQNPTPANLRCQQRYHKSRANLPAATETREQNSPSQRNPRAGTKPLETERFPRTPPA